MKGEVSIGTLIGGKYRIGRALGGGGMGNVYLATHTALGTQVALKMLRRDANDDEVRTRFQREGVLVAQLDSDHVVRVTDLGWADPETPYLVMELLDGRDLQDEIDQRGPLPVPEAVDLMLQALAGVAAAHAAGLVHRDLKPANLFLARRKGRAPVVKVLDFGLSKALRQGVLDSLTHETARFGTPVYMSPEQIRSSKNVDARADQYALAAVLYQCVTGRLPFEAASLTELFIEASTGEPRAPSSYVPSLPSKLEKAILRGLAKEPERRFKDVLALAEAIAPFGGPRASALLDEVRTSLASPSPRAEIEAAETEDSGVNQPARTAADPQATPPMDRGGAARPRLYGADDQAKTLVRAPPTPLGRAREERGEDSQVGLTSSMNAASHTRRRFAVASVAGALAVLAIWFVARALMPAEAPPGSAPASTAASVATEGVGASVAPTATPPPPASTQAPVAPEPAVVPAESAPQIAPAPSVSASASSTSEARRVEKPTPNKPATPKQAGRPAKPGEKSVLDVFGER